MKITRRSACLLIAGTIAGAAGTALPFSAYAQSGKQVIVAADEIPKQLDPLRSQLFAGYRVMINLYDTLIAVDYKDNGKLVPGLATSWKRIDDKTLELTLRQGVKFHDGSTMTAEDVVFSLSQARINTKGTPGYGTAQQFLSTIADAVIVNPTTVRVMSTVSDPTLEMRVSAWGSQIISKKAFDAAGGWDGFALKPVGTGPFRLANLSPEENRLVAFADYWGGKPNIDTLIFRSVPELSSRIAGVISGDFDIAVDVPPDQFAPIKNAKMEIVGGTIPSMRNVKFDTRNPVLADKRVRQALAMAVDREAIVKSLWAGMVDVPNGHQLKSYGALYDPTHPKWEYNPTKAKQLLAAAGYKGETIPYRIRNNAYGSEVSTAQILVSMWEAIGVKIDLQMKENFGQLLEFPGTGMRNGADPILVNDPLFGFWRSYNESERLVWSNEDFYKAGRILESSMDLQTRKAALKTMMTIFDDDPPAIILHTFGFFYGMNPKVKWTAYPHPYMDFRKENADKL
jgi:peptide/nickel transport system substrate-binding protein